jgi:futalosine hydrolase
MARRTGGICENMEGAAVAQVCALHGVPFLEVRGISNHTGDRDLSRWDVRKGAEIAQWAIRDFFLSWNDGKERA